jgi:hypothetical protein
MSYLTLRLFFFRLLLLSNICLLLSTCGYLHQYAADSTPCLLSTIISADDGKIIFSYHVWLPREEAISSSSKLRCSPRRRSKQPKDYINLERVCMHFVREASFWLATAVFDLCSYYVLLSSSLDFCSLWVPRNTLQYPSHLSINSQP